MLPVDSESITRKFVGPKLMVLEMPVSKPKLWSQTQLLVLRCRVVWLKFWDEILRRSCKCLGLCELSVVLIFLSGRWRSHFFWLGGCGKFAFTFREAKCGGGGVVFLFIFFKLLHLKKLYVTIFIFKKNNVSLFYWFIWHVSNDCTHVVKNWRPKDTLVPLRCQTC